MSKFLSSTVAIGALIGSSIASPVWAQATRVSQAEPQVYTPEYFAQFQPNTARDMVGRIPGFTLQGGEGGGRGFGQATLNILINGRRPSSKSSDAREILGRIPASTVKRIEIVDGASLDIPGLSGQVANIIASSGTLSGNWRYAARFEEGTKPQLLDASISLSGKRGNLEYVLGLTNDQFTFTESDSPEQFFNGNGTLIEDRIEDLAFAQERPEANLNLTLTRENGDVANLNLSGALRNRTSSNNEFFNAVTSEGVSGRSRSNNGEDEFRYEISGDYTTDFALFGSVGNLKLIGLHNLEDSDLTNTFEYVEFGSPLETVRFARDDIETEYIARAEYTWAQGKSQDWAFAIEGAFNALDSDTALFENDAEPDLENVRVEEKRAQANLTQSWALSERVNLQTSIGAEYSEIDVVTEADSTESFFRPKGFISASYQASPTYTWRGKIERSVGQLDFGTFISTINLSEDFASSGNRTVPDQRWGGEIELERQDDKVISGTLRAFVDFIDDPIDRVVFADGTEGAGNLDSATVYGASANLTWVMDSIGLNGMRLEIEGEVADSRIEDPVTGLNRTINSTTLWEYDIELRHDIPNTPYAWEVELEQGRRSEFFRIDNIFDTRLLRPEARISAIHKDFFGMQWSLSLSNIFDFRVKRDRTIFSPDRNGDIIQTQVFDRQRGRRLSISVTDTF